MDNEKDKTLDFITRYYEDLDNFQKLVAEMDIEELTKKEPILKEILKLKQEAFTKYIFHDSFLF